MKRILLFAVTNLLVVVAISFVIDLLGLRPYLTANGIDYQALLIFCALFGFGGAFISLQISRWSAKTAMGVRLIDLENPSNQLERRLADTVKSLCQRMELETLPEIGIYRSPEVNAFATGPSRSRALLAVSTGLLENMDSRAVEGVLGHEVSHIANGDMVTMTLLQGVINTFVMFVARIAAIAIDNAMRSRDGERRNGGLGFFAQFMLVSLLESVLMILASPVLYYYSRRREYKADANSARIAGAGTMIYALEALKRSTQVRDERAPSLSTFKINGHGHGLIAALYSSHPPIEARIEALRRGI
ncbi:MAG: zinc metalloprotease HtpX [Elusimicrobia bacterium RIFCSPHIGHO2_02_FULL_57_9]|nr:MAG: zinc metalloprotease HtpX [Elusimicrobia bacterium RIFCSPHIGHO2_02_FULL_57_9]